MANAKHGGWWFGGLIAQMLRRCRWLSLMQKIIVCFAYIRKVGSLECYGDIINPWSTPFWTFPPFSPVFFHG